jgi:predicted nucleotidyltransferase
MQHSNKPTLIMQTDISALVKKSITALFPDSEVVLFGSRARGDFREESDWDFLILLPSNITTNDDKSTVRDCLYELELETGAVLSAIVHTKGEWLARKVTPLYQRIEAEGKRA